MAQPPKKHGPESEKQAFVAEQNGKAWALWGLGLSVFIGLAVQSTFSPEKILVLVQRAADRIHPQIKMTLGSAELSLSDGLFPEFAILVHDVTAEGVFSSCEDQPKLSIDQIRLPMDFWSLLKGQMRLSTVQLGQVEILSDLETFRTCASRSPSGGPQEAASESPGEKLSPISQKDPAVGFLGKIRSERENPVESVSIQSLRFKESVFANLSFEFRQVLVRVQPQSDGATLEGQLIFSPKSSGYASLSEFGSKADVEIIYSKKPQERMQLEVQGAWREGQYRAKGQYDFQKQEFEIEGRAEHLPLAQVLLLADASEDRMESQLEGKQAWLSFQVSSMGPVSTELWSHGKVPLLMEHFQVEGDLGEVIGSQIRMTSQSPIRFAPFMTSMRGLKLEQFLKVLRVSHPSEAVADWGQFNGNLSYQDEKNLTIAGEHSGLQFIFSNRGHRELQTLSLMGGQAVKKNGSWEIEINQMRPLDGLFLGDIRLKTDEQMSRGSFDIKISEMALAPQIQKLMTGGGSLGSWSGRLRGAFAGGRVSFDQSTLEVLGLNVEKMSLNRARVNLASQGADLKLEVFGKGAIFDLQSPVYPVIAQVLKPLDQNEKFLEAEQVHLLFETKDFSTFKWTLSPIKVDRALLSSSGGWDSEGRLFGEFERAGEKKEFWKVGGTRSRPEFQKVEK